MIQELYTEIKPTSGRIHCGTKLDIAYFDQILRHQTKKALIASAMEKYYNGLSQKLGFKIF